MKINSNIHLQNTKAVNNALIKNQQTPSFGSLQSIGDRVLKSGTAQKIAKHFEYEGLSMPFISLAMICTGGVIIPRLVQARDKDEFHEILVRDCTTVGIMLFARKGLQNIFSKVMSKLSGLPLLKYPQKHKGTFNQLFNYLRPVNGVSILSSSDIASKYTNIDKFKNGIVDFCEFITKSGGDVKKVFTGNEKLAAEAKKAFEAAGTGKKFADATSQEIVEAFSQLHSKKSNALDGVYAFFKDGKNGIMSKARVLNSTFDFLATFVLVPSMLGLGLPILMENRLKDKYINKDNGKVAQQKNEIVKNDEKEIKPDNKPIQPSLKTSLSNKISAFKDFA